MAVLEMQRISICALKKDRKFILEKLQSLGVLEVDHVIGEDEDFKKMDTAGRRQGFEKAAVSADQALELLEKYVPEKKSMFAALEGKTLIEPEQERRVREERRDILRAAREIYELDRQRAEELAQIAKLENSIESLTPWLGLDVPMRGGGTRRTAMLIGTMPGETTVESIHAVLEEKAPGISGADVHVVSEEQSAVCLALICLKEDAASVEEALRSAGFAKPAQMWDGVPAEEKKALEARREQDQDRRDREEDRRIRGTAGEAEDRGGLLSSPGGEICRARAAPPVGEDVRHKRLHPEMCGRPCGGLSVGAL